MSACAASVVVSEGATPRGPPTANHMQHLARGDGDADLLITCVQHVDTAHAVHGRIPIGHEHPRVIGAGFQPSRNVSCGRAGLCAQRLLTLYERRSFRHEQAWQNAERKATDVVTHRA